MSKVPPLGCRMLTLPDRSSTPEGELRQNSTSPQQSIRSTNDPHCLEPALCGRTTMEDGNNASEPAAGRWTCEACSCNTNSESDRTCTICGTSKSGPSILRRAGAAGYASRAGWFARGGLSAPDGGRSSGNARRAAAAVAGMAGIMGDEMSLDDDDLWESVVHGAGGDIGPDMEELAMDVGGVGGAAALGGTSSTRNRLMESSRQRFLEAARAFSNANREVQTSIDPDELFRTAAANAAQYQPHWANPSTLTSSRGRDSNGIEVGEGTERRNLALLPMGAGEGRAIRAEQPLTRIDSFNFRRHSPSAVAAVAAAQQMNNAAAVANPPAVQGTEPRRRAFGFRVAFDHPTTGDVKGANMGGCYLVGITTSSFTSYNEQNGLQQSPFFWGIEDGGQKYEGSRHCSSRSARRTASGTSSTGAYAVELGAQEARMNSQGVLFGAREVVTCVCDLDARTLTFWRDETLLGTLVTNLPRGGLLYPVAVPFNCGVTVAITGLDNDPLPLLRTFAIDWRKVKQEKDAATRSRLLKERSVLIQDGSISPQLGLVLENIFSTYMKRQSGDTEKNEMSLTYTVAARLWYTCGMKLSSLHKILQSDGSFSRLQFIHFLDIIEQVIQEDEIEHSALKSQSTSSNDTKFKVGDKVELVGGYERYGDAAGGPLQNGDRGVVVELQVGPSGEQRSVRVLHSGRRWWYQPQAVVSEGSGLTESPGVWFLRGILRPHGYNHTTLKSIVRTPVTALSWCVGDVVVPKKVATRSRDGEAMNTHPSQVAMGRIVAETPGPTSPTAAPLSRDGGTVVVEFLSRDFAEGVGSKLRTTSSSDVQALETRRVRISKLLHSTVLNVHGSLSEEKAVNTEDVQPSDSTDSLDILSPSITDKVRSDIAALGRLERPAIDSLTKECHKGSDALASLFSAGLQDAIQSALNVAERQMNSLEPRDDLSDKLSAIGSLASSIVEELFGSAGSGLKPEIEDEMSLEPAVTHRPPSPQNRPRHLRNRASRNDRRSQVRDPVRNDAGDDDREGLVSSLQQRRNMLLSLMSRASRRNTAGSFMNDVAEGMDPARHMDRNASPAAAMRGVPPFVFGSSSDFLESGSWEEMPSYSIETGQNQPTSPSAQEASADQQVNTTGTAQYGPSSFLDSILRCRGDAMVIQLASGQKQGGAAYSVFVRHLIASGILVDQVDWIKALVEAHAKKVQMTTLQKTTSVLRSVVDEEGNSLLLLAISLGCSSDVISCLVALGAPVGTEEIKQAAKTNQPSVLSLLLQHTSYTEGDIDVSKCSSAVSSVLSRTKSRQDKLDRQMREAAGDFMVQLLRKLFKLGLSSRRTRTARIDMCSKVICEMLVGNVLLRALQHAQKPNKDHLLTQAEREASEKSGRFFVNDNDVESIRLSQGLLSSLPRKILGDYLFNGNGDMTMYLLLCEDYLCSKDMADIASGLTFLHILLSKFPKLRSCEELHRFGMSDFVANHSMLASDRIAETLSKQLTVGLDVSSSPGHTPRSEAKLATQQESPPRCGVVLCPKKHIAVLHITRHSSFRCDLCASGVERGRPMHGCRECDWDACENCTDRSESGLVKCSALKKLASDCTRLLTDGTAEEENDDFVYNNVQSSTDSLSDLCARLRMRDVLAAKELGILLNSPGKITIHQFMSNILPSLHSSLVGRPKNADEKHRSKKARRVQDDNVKILVDSRDSRLQYCRETLRCIMKESPSECTKIPSVASLTNTDASKPNIIQGSEKDENRKPSETDEGAKIDISYSAGASEILRRLHQVLSFFEGVQVFASSQEKLPEQGTASKPGDLYSLTKPIELHLSPSSFRESEAAIPRLRSLLYAEPLIPISDLQLHVLRTYRINDPSYTNFCRRLAWDSAIVVERPMKKTGFWKIARVLNFDESTGAHSLRYASGWERGHVTSELHVNSRTTNDYTCFQFLGRETTLVMAARQYYVLFRQPNPSATSLPLNGCDDEDESMSCSDDPTSQKVLAALGTRVECSTESNDEWSIFTLVGKTDVITHGEEDTVRFVVVSDEGELHTGLSSNQIRVDNAHDGDVTRPRHSTASRSSRDDRNGLFPFFAARQRPEFLRDDSEISLPSATQVKALKRTWSALALIDEMRPLDLVVSGEPKEVVTEDMPADLSLSCKLDDQEFRFLADASALEPPPSLSVRFSAHETLPGVDFLSPDDKTLISALKEVHQKQEKWSRWPPHPSCGLFFSVRTESSDLIMSQDQECFANKGSIVDSRTRESDLSTLLRSENRSRKLSSRSLTNDDNSEDSVSSLCDGIDEVCVQCMEIVSLLSECAEDRSSPMDREVLNLPGFANPTLSKKLVDQLDDPLCVVGGALPDWCILATSFSPRVFSYESRRMLLERAAFGVSRSTLRQQESKVKVGRLRQRMQSLRARAVELVGEAFSGGAEDPTALQLQADELYGMEEALATRVRSSFRAVKWQEHSLEVAKAVVNRNNLLSDASLVMDKYANDSNICRRRLEIRFSGESGFDAASGDEAGVTRGFYADCAEALLAAENIAGAYCSGGCSHASPLASEKKQNKVQPMDIDDSDTESTKLPLWIPDMDSSAQVIIPTPRADKRSDLGVFPRALPHYHPQFGDVLRKFRFMGRLFAAAMRDGFMFPLPLSASFLQLVQNGSGPSNHKADQESAPHSHDLLLSSSDLPRPGFLGGEVYAAEFHICKALDRLDAANPPLSRHELRRQYEEIATDKEFAREAFGKSYEYSFEEYFQDRTFVDPLDPDQGVDAVPLCARGHSKAVTVYNIREWVTLAKNFILHDGVIEQALAFRRGVEDFFEADHLRIFTSEELQRDVCGVGDEVDNWNESAVRKLFKLDGGKGAAEALVAVAAIGGEGGAALSRRFGPSSPTIAFLVKALLDATPKQRRQFLSFVTSVPIVTPGRIEVVPILSPNGEFLPMQDPSCLPRANTCSRRLYLPKFEAFDTFSSILWAVVREESKFKGFYEWRGN